MPVWHASISAHDRTGQLPWDQCGLKARALLRDTVIGLLSGVGSGAMRRDWSSVVLHARKRLSDQELTLLTPAWCAIPAEAIAGDGIPW